MCYRVLAEIEIYQAANLLIQRHGRDAVVEADRLLDLMLDRGDMDGQASVVADQGAIVQLVVRPAAGGMPHGREPQPGRSTAISAGQSPPVFPSPWGP